MAIIRKGTLKGILCNNYSFISMANMENILSYLKGIWGKILSEKRFFYPFLWVLVIIVAALSYLWYSYISERLRIPVAQSANFSLQYRKIPFDAKYIDITFSTNLNHETVNEKNIQLSPFVEWWVSLEKWNTIRYSLSKNLEIWKEYSITVSKKVESEYWISIKNDYTVVFEAISWAKVTKIIPDWTLENISQNLLVLFNIPLIPLTNLDNQDKMPCPLDITPKIAWRCKWTWWNALEFIPEKHWQWATEYSVKVLSSSWLLYPLKETKEIRFKTPWLQFFSDNNFSPRYWIFFRSNFPIDPKQAERNISISDPNGLHEAVLEPEVWSDTRFFLKIKDSSYKYATNYNILVKKWIQPLYWNQPTGSDTTLNTTSYNLLQNVTTYANTYSETWSIVWTPSFEKGKPIPNKNVFFEMRFDDDMPLDKEKFNFSNSKWKSFAFDIKYWTETEYIYPEWIKKKESKKIIILTLKENLAYATKYSLTLPKRANPSMIKDEIYDFITVPEFKITSFDYKTNTLACVYFSNDLAWQAEYWYESDMDANQNLVTTSPSSSVRWLSKDRITNYETKARTCPQKDWQISYLLNLRLDPYKSYEVQIPQKLADNYWNKLLKDYKFNVKSWWVSEIDKYIYSSFSKRINVIPDWVPAVINIQSVNIDKAKIEVCEMDETWYSDFVIRSYETWFTPKCLKTEEKEVNLKNKNWTLSNNRFDIEKDIAGSKIESKIYLVRWSVNWSYLFADWKDFSNIIIRSNLSLAMEKAKNKTLLFASSFDWKEQPSDLKIRWFKFDSNFRWNLNEINWFKAKFDKTKSAYEIQDVDFIIASNNKFYGVINGNADQASNYDFKYVAWQDASMKDYLYLYTERPIYRPWDTVYFKWLLRTFDFTWYKKSESKTWRLKIINENWEFFKEIKVNLDKNSNFSWKFELPKQMWLWRYSFEFYPEYNPDSVYNDWQFFVEEYKKPTFKINMDWGKKDVMLWDNINLNFNAEYYFWGKLTQSTYSRSILAQNYFFDAKDYSEYQFSEGNAAFDCLYWWYCNNSDSLLYSDSWEINGNPDWTWKYDFPKDELDQNKNPNWEKIYSFTITMGDPDTKKQVTKTYWVVLHNTDAYVWLKVPYFSTKNDWIKFDWVVLDYNANWLSWKDIKLELIRREWKQVKKQWVDWIFYNDYSIEETKELETSASSNSKWEFSETLNPLKTWEYMIRATYTWANWKSFVTSSYAYVAWDEANYWYDWNNTVTDLVADKWMLKVWETAKFTLKSPVSSWKAFIAIEKDDWILDYKIQDINSTWERIEIPVKQSYYPNFYVKVFLIWKEWSNPLPVFKRALNVIKVVTDYKNIKVSIKPAKNRYLPWEKVKLSIKTTDSDWKPIPYANWSLSLVDESLLALKWNPHKNPFAFFYDMKRYLWVETYLSLMNLIDKLEVKDISDWEKWWAWDWSKWGDSKKKRWVFKDTAYWQADFTTDKNWLYEVTTDPLPDNLTTWVIESLVTTPTDNKVWVWETTIITTKKVIVNDNLPRFLWSKDGITISPQVFNKTWKNSEFKVSIKADWLKISNPETTVNLWNWEQKTVTFKATVDNIWVKWDYWNSSKINIKAVAVATWDQDEIEKILPIAETSIKEFVATTWQTDSVATEKIEIWDIPKESTKLTLRYSPTLLSNLLSWIDFLAEFPYWCLEQKQSAIMPNVYLKRLYDAAWQVFDLSKKNVKVYIDSDTWYKNVPEDEIIRNYIAESEKYQKFNWWFVYWSDSNERYADFRLTSIIVKWMSELKAIWFKINEVSIKDALAYLKTRFYANQIEWCSSYSNSDICKYPETYRLNAIDALLSYNPSDYEWYKMWKVLNLKWNEISTKVAELEVIWKLLNNKNLKTNEKADLKKKWIRLWNEIIKENLVYNPRWAFLWKDSSDSRISNTAKFIWAISDLWISEFKDSAQIIDNMVRWIISEKKWWSFGSTQENINTMEWLTKYMLAKAEIKWIKSKISVTLNENKISEANIDNKNIFDTFEKIMTWNSLLGSNTISINKAWNWNVYYDLDLSYYLPTDKLQARDEGFFLEQKYYDYNNYRKIETLKKKEFNDYMNWAIDYDSLKYPKNITEYLSPVKDIKMWQLLIANTKIVTSEPRDNVAFEWFIPSGSELINTNLSTEDWSIKFQSIFDKEEFRDDRYFWYSKTMNAWLYEFNYAIRITHAWTFLIKPSTIYEFYTPEIFWRTIWNKMEIK